MDEFTKLTKMLPQVTIEDFDEVLPPINQAAVQLTAGCVSFEMTPFIWNEAAVFIGKDGRARLDKEHLPPDKPIKVVVLGDQPTAEQMESVKLIQKLLSNHFGIDRAAFCPAIANAA